MGPFTNDIKSMEDAGNRAEGFGALHIYGSSISIFICANSA